MESVRGQSVTEQKNTELIAIVGATVIDGNGGPPINDGAILIEGKHIRAVEDHADAIPARARVISARGKFVIPGLMCPQASFVPAVWPPDLKRCEGRYDQVALEAAQLALKGGVTTAFEALGPRDSLLKTRDAINNGSAVGARIHLCGHYIGLGGPFSPDLNDHGKDNVGERSAESKLASEIAAADVAFKARTNALWEVNVGEALTRMPLREVRAQVRDYLQSGVDYVTYLVNAHRLGAYQYIAFSPRVQRMIVEEAHRAGLPVKAFFASTEEGVNLALESGVDIVAPSLWQEQPLSEETLAVMAKMKAFVHINPEPTGTLEWYRQQPPNALYPGLIKTVETAALDHRSLVRAGARIISTGWCAMHSAEPLKVIRSGAAPGSRPEMGEGHIRGLQALEDAGMTPMAALMAATRNVAQAFKVDKELGTLESGKLADLVVLQRNPLESAENYRSIHFVMKEGMIVDRDALPTQRLWSAPKSRSGLV